jgi:hypothetical protein
MPSQHKSKYIFTEAMNAEIRKVYQEKVGMGSRQNRDSPVATLARKFGIPRQTISWQAVKLGLIRRKKKEPPWSPEEIKILECHAWKGLGTIQKHLSAKGYRRTKVGILIKRKHLRLLSNLDGQSASSLADCFGIDTRTIIRWINLGYLKAYRRETDRTPAQGGDIYYIKDKHVKDFIMNYLDEIDIRKVDKYWLVGILTGELE